uniref:MABP domain-containing protein n=1 Tax=Rhabditophanes sp. KR3021 TaxID=114890 RepID=A0AC35TT15_9BILA
MLARTSELDGENGTKPIYGIVIIADQNKAPTHFTPIIKTFDDSSDADLWKESGFMSFLNRPVRYLCVSKTQINGQSEILHDIQITKEDAVIPHGFTEISATSDSRERSLRKRRLLVSFLPKERIIDAITEIIIVKSKKPYRGYTPAGEIDGLYIWYKATPINVCITGMSKSISNPVLDNTLYPNLPTPSNSIGNHMNDYNNLANDVHSFTIKTVDEKQKIVQKVPFVLNDLIVSNDKTSSRHSNNIPEIPYLKSLNIDNYKFDLERSILSM